MSMMTRPPPAFRSSVAPWKCPMSNAANAYRLPMRARWIMGPIAVMGLLGMMLLWPLWIWIPGRHGESPLAPLEAISERVRVESRRDKDAHQLLSQEATDVFAAMVHTPSYASRRRVQCDPLIYFRWGDRRYRWAKSCESLWVIEGEFEYHFTGEMVVEFMHFMSDIDTSLESDSGVAVSAAVEFFEGKRKQDP